jgi:hypothetical protein
VTEGKEQYQVKISNMFLAVENLDGIRDVSIELGKLLKRI